MLPAPPSADRQFDVVGIGATSVDFVYQLPAYPSPTASLEKMRISRHFVSCGGQVATALATCARLGLRAKFVGVTGTDDNAKRVRRDLEERGVDVTDAVIRDVSNQYAVILVDQQSGERIVLWDRDDRLRLRDRELPPEIGASARVVHVDDVDIDAAIRAAGAARAAGAVVTSDIDRVDNRTIELVKSVTFPMFAEHVPSTLTGLTDPAAALRALRPLHDGVLCVTLGARGAMALEGDRLLHLPAFAVHAVDTTGAGDVFRASFIYGYLHGWPLEDTIRFANAAAAVSCTRLGAMASVPSLDEAERLMAQAGCPIRR
ncbi:MAG: ribokinase [Acidobacteria bacterium]|nr:ribokinase [Acidobacteriota bacterium]